VESLYKEKPPKRLNHRKEEFIYFFLLFCFGDTGLNLGPHVYKAGTLISSAMPPVCFALVRWVLANYLSGLTLNYDPPNLSLLST
jgi:hypothetical protein